MYRLSKSSSKTKKYDVITPDDKLIRFGQDSASDFTIHKDEVRKQRYLDRHEANEDWTNLNSAGAWSRWILWNKPTIRSSIKDMEKRFNIAITNTNN